MIARRLRMNTLSKSSMVRLVNYLTNPMGVDARVGEVRITNCEAETADWAALEMQAVQKKNTRAKGDKTYHLLLSFHEQPNSATLGKIADYICKELGYSEHQRVSVAHHDTDNFHLHIAINKIHPARLTMCEPYYDEEKLAKCCNALERIHGLQPDNHIPKAQAAETAATNMENAGDLESLTGWIRRTCLDDIKAANNWKEIHDILARNGLELRERGNGLVFVSGDVHVKASSVDRQLSRKRLEDRLGAFTLGGGTAQTKNAYVRKPLGKQSESLWQRYTAFLEQNDSLRKKALFVAKQTRDAELQELKTSSDLRLVIIRNLGIDPAFKKFLAHLNRERLRRKSKKIRDAYSQKRKATFQKFRHMHWSSWLTSEAANGNTNALRYLQSRKSAGSASMGKLSGLRRDGVRPPIQKVTRKGAFLYAQGREVRDHVHVAQTASDQDVVNSLTLASQMYGSHLKVDGSKEFQERVARLAREHALPVSFVDRKLEALRQGRESSIVRRHTR